VQVWLNTTAANATTATFASGGTIATNTNSNTEITIADVDGDGKRDVVVAGSGVTVFRNTTAAGETTMTFTSHNVPFLTNATVHVADVNGDQKADLIGVRYSVVVAVQGSNLNFTNTVTLGNSGPNAYVNDVNGDGKLDISSLYSTYFYTYVNTTATTGGTPSFAQHMPVAGVNVGTMADLDTDGKSDWVINVGSYADRMMFNTTTTVPSFTQGQDYDGVSNPFVLDVNADGRLDLVGWRNGSMAALLNTGTATAPTFSAVSAPFNGPGSTRIVPADLNGDGRLDLLYEATTNNVTIMMAH
jgi:hypothetical protein